MNEMNPPPSQSITARMWMTSRVGNSTLVEDPRPGLNTIAHTATTRIAVVRRLTIPTVRITAPAAGPLPASMSPIALRVWGMITALASPTAAINPSRPMRIHAWEKS